MRTEYGKKIRIFPHSVQMRENMEQNNPEYGHLLRSIEHSVTFEEPKMRQRNLENSNISLENLLKMGSIIFCSSKSWHIDFVENVVK